MKVGILGGGNISETHARAAIATPGLEIAAIYGTNRKKAAHFARLYGGTVYHDLDAFLAHRPMDLVAIGSPSGLHAAHGIAAARQGLHVLVEKPADITASRVDALAAAGDEAGVKIGVFFQDRLKPDIVQIKRLVDAGRLGTPILASGRVKWHRSPEYYAGSRWRGTWALDGGGALMNQAIHTVDLLLWLFGPVNRVHASTATRLHAIEVEDTAAAVLEFASGALGVLEAATSVFPGYARRIELTGSEGTLILEGDSLVAVDVRDLGRETRNGAFSPREALEGSAPEARRRARASGGGPPRALGEARATLNPELGAQAATSPVVSDVTAHKRVFEDFVRAIETNGTPACDAREGRRSVALVEAMYAAARAGRVVELQ